MEKDNKVYILHILDAIGAIEKYTKDFDRKKFIDGESRLFQDAVIRELEVIGEAVRNISSKAKDNNPNLPWREIEGMRNKLIHEYFGVNLGVVWQTVVKDLPILKDTMNLLLDLTE
jgi:uncharacterized protein with HEPN domain